MDEVGENVQAKSRGYFRFRIFVVRLFVTTYTDGTVPALQSFRGILLQPLALFFITEKYSGRVSTHVTQRGKVPAVKGEPLMGAKTPQVAEMA